MVQWIKTHGSVTAAKDMETRKKDAQHTSMLSTGSNKLQFSASHISKTTEPIYTKFIYFMPYIYTTLHTNFEGNRLIGFQDMHS